MSAVQLQQQHQQYVTMPESEQQQHLQYAAMRGSEQHHQPYQRQQQQQNAAMPAGTASSSASSAADTSPSTAPTDTVASAADRISQLQVSPAINDQRALFPDTAWNDLFELPEGVYRRTALDGIPPPLGHGIGNGLSVHICIDCERRSCRRKCRVANCDLFCVSGSTTSSHYTNYIKKPQGGGTAPNWYHMTIVCEAGIRDDGEEAETCVCFVLLPGRSRYATTFASF